MARKRKPNYEQKTLREKKLDFRRHFRTYLVMSCFFIALNLFGGSNHAWAIWPILGWGIGVALQGLSLYGPLADPEDAHPEREIEDEFSGPLPDVTVTDEDLRRRRDAMELKEIERNYRDEDLV